MSPLQDSLLHGSSVILSGPSQVKNYYLKKREKTVVEVNIKVLPYLVTYFFFIELGYSILVKISKSLIYSKSVE